MLILIFERHTEYGRAGMDEKRLKGMSYSDRFIIEYYKKLEEENYDLKACNFKLKQETDKLRRQLMDCGKTLSEVLEGRVN